MRPDRCHPTDFSQNMNTVIFLLMQITDNKSNMPCIMRDYSKFNRSPYVIKGTNETPSLKGTVKLSVIEGMEKGKKTRMAFNELE